MTLTAEDVVTHYLFSSHPRNRAIVDIKNKKTGDIKFIKIRHRLDNFYAVSLVDPISFEVYAETQTKSATAKVKPIVIHGATNGVQVDLRGSSRIGFEWTFDWEGEKYKWVKESKMSGVLECRAIKKTGDVCIAQYLPRVLKDEYFGIFSILGYNILRCHPTQSRELELVLFMSLLTLLDKSDNNSWKRDPISKGVKDDIKLDDSASINVASTVTQYEDPIQEKALRKKIKTERNNEQKLKVMIEKGVRKSQKQFQTDHATIETRKQSNKINSESSISNNSTVDTTKEDRVTVGTLTQLFLEMGNLRHDEYPITPPTLSPSSFTSSRSRSSSVGQSPIVPTGDSNSSSSSSSQFTSYNQKHPTSQLKAPSCDNGVYSHQGKMPLKDGQRGNQRYTYNQQDYHSFNYNNSSATSLITDTRRPPLSRDRRRMSATEYSSYTSHQYAHDHDQRGRYSLSEFHNDNKY